MSKFCKDCFSCIEPCGREVGIDMSYKVEKQIEELAKNKKISNEEARKFFTKELTDKQLTINNVTYVECPFTGTLEKMESDEA